LVICEFLQDIILTQQIKVREILNPKELIRIAVVINADDKAISQWKIVE
jgi:hypothetical protein